MDFNIYYSEILIPYLDMVSDMYRCNDISYENALRLGACMCDIDICLLLDNKIHYDMLEKALYDFEISLKQFDER